MKEISKWRLRTKIEDINVHLSIIEQDLKRLGERIKNTDDESEIAKSLSVINELDEQKELLEWEERIINKLLAIGVHKITIYND